MSDLYIVKYNSGAASFEIQGNDKVWVDQKYEALKTIVVSNTLTASPAKSIEKKAPAVRSSSKKKVGRSATTTAQEDSSLVKVWNETLAEEIVTWVSERQASFDGGTTHQAAILAVFMKDKLKLNEVRSSDLEVIYRKLGWVTINHDAQLKNAYSRNKYFTLKNGIYELTHTGIVFGRDTSKIVKEKK